MAVTCISRKATLTLEIAKVCPTILLELRGTSGESDFALLKEGVRLFPRSTMLVERVAGLFLAQGRTAEATAILERGWRETTNESAVNA